MVVAVVAVGLVEAAIDEVIDVVAVRHRPVSASRTVVVRAKALVRLRDRSGSRWLFGRGADDPVGEPYEVDGLRKAPSSLVCIGPGLDPEAIRNLVAEFLEDPAAQLP